jgi:hypothetical protein
VVLLVVVPLAWVLALGAPQRLLVVLAPLVWGATGLMVTPVLSAAEFAVTGGPSTEALAGDALHAWVYAVVYLGFAVQGSAMRRFRSAGRPHLALAARAAAGACQPRPWSAARRLGRWLVWDFCCWRAESTRFASVGP